MRTAMGAAFTAAALALGAPATTAGDSTAPQAKAVAASEATDFGARRRYRRYPAYPSYARYPSYPAYYARPHHYRPYPYAVPVPFFLGFGYLPHH